MKKIILICTVLNCCISIGHSQIGLDTVKYSVVKNKPNTPYFGVGLSYDIDLNSHNMTLAAFGFDGTFLHEKFSLNFNSRYHLGERLSDFSGNEPYATSIYEPEHSRDLSFLGTFYFISDVLSGDIDVLTHRTGSGKYRVEHYVTIPGKFSLRYGVDLGYSTGVTYYNFQEDEIMQALDMSGNEVEIGQQNERSIASYYKYSYLSIGINRTRVDQMVINTDRYGVRSDNVTKTIYARALIGLTGVIDDVYLPYDFTQPDNGPYTQYSLSPMAFNRMGGCIGWSTYQLKKMGIGTDLQAGLLPGPKTNIVNNLYLAITMKFHFAKYL